MKLCLLCLLCLLAPITQAGDFDWRIALFYWHNVNVGGTTMETEKLWHLYTENGRTSIDEWNVPGHAKPAKAELEALWPAAVAWWPDWQRQNDAEVVTRRMVHNGADIVILPDEYGLIYQFPDGRMWQVFVCSNGVMGTCLIAESPEVSLAERRARLRAARAKLDARGGWQANGQLQARLEAIERHLGWRP